ncbi:MAG: NAD-dependent malic enzyme [Acetobacteraceae bacterium]|nr:NAD-dependent malic enzyme [Acetobacteraceae bacterium]
MDIREEALKLHRENVGKIEFVSKVPVRNKEELSLAYTPGVAEPCKEIHKNVDAVWEYTARSNIVAVVSDGTAVLGLGDIGPEAGLPVMEGKCVLFKSFAGVDAFPLCVATKDVKEIVRLVQLIEPTIGGVNLEDISAPRCFEIEQELKRTTSIPIFHDDQHGTAIVCGGALFNALRIVQKRIEDIYVVINGAGAAGIAVAKFLLDAGVRELVLCDTRGIVWAGRPEGMNPFKEDVARRGNKRNLKGDLAVAMRGADVFIGVSAAGAVTRDMVRSMAGDPIVFAMANPVPEIMPEEARAGGAAVVGTGRSDFANQINNVLAFPGVLRGALDVRARDINEAMKLAGARAIASLISDAERSPDYVIPRPFDRRVAPAVAAAVAEAAMSSGVARLKVNPEDVAERTRKLVERVQAAWR